MDLLQLLLLAVIVLFVALTTAAYMTLAERKIAGYIQQRPGPNRVGPWGLMQPAADAVKLILQEDIVPAGANRSIHFMAPVIGVTLAVLGLAILPFARGWHIFDANIGILYTLMVGSIAVYSVTLAGWSSNSKYSLLGGLRSSAQMISYELSMGISVVSIILLANHYAPAGSEILRLPTIVEAQTSMWFIVLNPLGFLIFFTCVIAECNRSPFDLAEAEQELVAGFHTEYSSMKFGAFYLAEYLHIFIGSAITATLFLGGYLGIGENVWYSITAWDPILQLVWGIGWFMAKTLFLVFVVIWIRWTLPRFKYNQLMDIGWKSFLPLSLINLLVLAGVLLWLAQSGIGTGN